jgi:hypothetical protein
MKKFLNVILLIIIFTSCKSSEKKDDPALRLKYVNTKYMFTLQFPEKWISYMDFEMTEIIDPQIVVPVVYFALPTRSREWQPVNIPSGFADLFHVRLFTKEQWKLFNERYKGTDEIKLSDLLPGEGKNFVYMIRYSNSIPVDLYLHMTETNSITDTFRIIKKD